MPGRYIGLAILLGGALSACGDTTVDPPTNGSVALFYDVNVDDLDAGLEDLASIEIRSVLLTAKWHDGAGTSDEVVLSGAPPAQLLPAENRIVFGPTFEIAPGYVTQLRAYLGEVVLEFGDGHSETVRVPSGEQTGWKIVVDEEEYPDGYPIGSREVTGILLDIDVEELLHTNAHGWQARPTIQSSLYSVAEQQGYEPDKIVVVFAPGTAQPDIDAIVAGGGFLVDWAYRGGSPLLYKLDLAPNTDLQQAHSYLRGFSEVVAAAPSANLRERLVPTEGTPPELQVIGAETGWDSGTGSPSTVAGIISFGLNTEHPELRTRLWLNEDEILPLCPGCDVDGDTFVTLADFNDGAYAGPAVPDVGDAGVITCRDLLDPGSPFMDGNDDGGNGFPDDLCGWNFGDDSPNVVADGGGSDNDHDTAVLGIMGATGNDGGNVGACWNCRLMVVIAKVGNPFDETILGATGETMAAFAYAQDEGAHVMNFSAGVDLTRDDADLCPSRAYQIKDDAWDTVLDEMNQLVTSVFSSAVADDTAGTTLFTLAGGECDPGIDDGTYEYYDWPPEAFASTTAAARQALTVAATSNGATDDGPLAGYSNFGAPFEIAAPGSWTNLLDGSDGNAYDAPGTSFAAPTVAGVAALVVSNDLATYGPQTAGALKTDLLDDHTVVDGDVSAIPTSKVVTMDNL